jgi:hypothetical protein
VIISTGSYAGWRPEHGTPVRITLGIPRWPRPPGRERWIYLAELAPRPWYFRAAPEKFDRMFRAQMDRLAADIVEKLTWITGKYGPCSLLCYERRVRGPQDCHRRAAARWLEDRLGIEVPELDGRERTRS